jgi:hypothetical protein
MVKRYRQRNTEVLGDKPVPVKYRIRHLPFSTPIGAPAPGGPEPPLYRHLTIALRHTTLGRTPLDE